LQPELNQHLQQQQQQHPMDMMMMDVPFNNQLTSDYMEDQQQQHVDDYNQQPDQFQPQDNFYFDSEYGKADASGLDLSTSSSRVVLRQDSASSLDHNLDISLKKIEVMEDEYGKMKMALLSDLDDPDQDQDFLPSPCVPEYHPLASHERPSHPPRQRSRDNLESIFGGGPIYSDPVSPALEGSPSFPYPVVDATTESRSSNYTTAVTTSSTSYLSSSFTDSQPQPQTQPHESNFSVEEFHSIHRAGGRSMIEEPFPVCVSPEMELSVSSIGSSAAVNRSGQIDTIPEVPEEEEGSPTAGDGVSRKRRGKPDSKLMLSLLFLELLLLLLFALFGQKYVSSCHK
jgi:hypothetical protein